MLYFHPEFQPASRFRYFGRQTWKGQETQIVGFAETMENSPPVTEFQQPDVLHQNQTIGILVQGLAWIDPTSFEIMRIRKVRVRGYTPLSGTCPICNVPPTV